VHRVPTQPRQAVDHHIAFAHGGQQLIDGGTLGARPRNLLLKDARTASASQVVSLGS